MKEFWLYLNWNIFFVTIFCTNFSYEIAYTNYPSQMNFSLMIIVLIALFQTITDIKDVSQDSILKWNNHLKKNKIKRGESRVNYYANHIATYNLILAGDIELNPGPVSHPTLKASKRNAYGKAFGTNRKQIKCDVCHNLMHVSCLNISKHR